jgi:transcriptional regulator with XRE-family HTH domain
MNRLKTLRTQRGLTQLKLSMELHVSQQYISRVEHGASLLTEDIILHLSNYFHVSIAYLLGATNDRNSEWHDDNRDRNLKRWIAFYQMLNEKNRTTAIVLMKHLIKEQSEK